MGTTRGTKKKRGKKGENTFPKFGGGKKMTLIE